MDAQFDEALIQIAKSHSSIEELLDTFMSFLKRRTDFFDIMRSESDCKGFPEGVAEQILLKAFKRAQSGATKRPDPVATAAPQRQAELPPKRLFPYNGGSTDLYTWSQTHTEIALELNLAQKSKQVKVDIMSQTLQISYPGIEQITLQLTHQISPSESFWYQSENAIEFQLEKKETRWWPSLTLDGPEIDLSKIDSSKKIHELPDDSQAMVRKILHEKGSSLSI